MREDEKDKEEEAAAPAWGVIKNKVISCSISSSSGSGGGEPTG